jgi:hypothetical protein
VSSTSFSLHREGKLGRGKEERAEENNKNINRMAYYSIEKKDIFIFYCFASHYLLLLYFCSPP